ncbi:hypothetical protein COU79_05390 [Candidatus Peregrinibacteria bacterium CG10_big_fil_rev_8_21_14_0_10_54_7]|nr:MAG: hypothetical protein COU79_05390 [Candidatus Peregrinibacteria bacterium CG10_big_fil_rev_8_21_14_0_10_54_7]
MISPHQQRTKLKAEASAPPAQFESSAPIARMVPLAPLRSLLGHSSSNSWNPLVSAGQKPTDKDQIIYHELRTHLAPSIEKKNVRSTKVIPYSMDRTRGAGARWLTASGNSIRR